MLSYVYMIVLLVSAKSHASMHKCIPHAESCLNYLYNIHILYLSLSMTMKLWFWSERSEDVNLHEWCQKWIFHGCITQTTIILFITKLWFKEPLLHFLGILVMKFALAFFDLKGIVMQLWQRWTQGISQPEWNNDSLVYHVCDVDYNKT